MTSPRTVLAVCLLLWPTVVPDVHADVTTCSLAGEYVLTASLIESRGAAQITGTFTFKPASASAGDYFEVTFTTPTWTTNPTNTRLSVMVLVGPAAD